ncbi:MAG: DUF1467 family protein [Aestuariivita sp.]|nr:DUF1467 family protein [Aestuariivita sp.]MCY4203169.1 DUF1467 family protein [Aestuariivita sp.]MCY4287760.1 DUF1467 family protein [Aestuariivita sp.]MCY4345719.1 DUF1467 family protein [Aestuariivita sp.]
MAITSALVLYAVFWVLIFLILLPVRINTQGDVNDIVEGTPSSAPIEHHLQKKAWITSIAALVLWAIAAGVILTDVITLEDVDLFHR